ncbi:MAG: hypothetical protein JWM11_2698 [Planctomycetaceae bacterium]|nr:hypothetical protein [Planctomycetaceae bacterium]
MVANFPPNVTPQIALRCLIDSPLASVLRGLGGRKSSFSQESFDFSTGVETNALVLKLRFLYATTSPPTPCRWNADWQAKSNPLKNGGSTCGLVCPSAAATKPRTNDRACYRGGRGANQT